MSRDKVVVSKINIKIGKKEIPLLLEEAKELQELLNQTFGKEEIVYIPGGVTYIPYQVYHPKPYRYWDVTWAWGTNTTTVSDRAPSGTLTYSLTNQTQEQKGR